MARRSQALWRNLLLMFDKWIGRIYIYTHGPVQSQPWSEKLFVVGGQSKQELISGQKSCE